MEKRHNTMIDFINPQSKKYKIAQRVSLVLTLLFLVGAYIVYDNGKFVIENQIISNQNTALPSGDLILQDIDIAELKAQYDEPLGPTQAQWPEEITPADPTEQLAQYGDNSGVIPADHTAEATETVAQQPLAVAATTEQVVPTTNTLRIAKIGVDGTVHEGATESVLWNGIWRLPMTSDNPEEGNMVLSAHRFLEQGGPNSFFHLDKVAAGDTFTLYWDGNEYTYKVREIKVVEPTEIEILHNTPNPQVTLFTCTPLWTSDQRLVVIGDLVN